MKQLSTNHLLMLDGDKNQKPSCTRGKQWSKTVNWCWTIWADRWDTKVWIHVGLYLKQAPSNEILNKSNKSQSSFLYNILRSYLLTTQDQTKHSSRFACWRFTYYTAYTTMSRTTEDQRRIPQIHSEASIHRWWLFSFQFNPSADETYEMMSGGSSGPSHLLFRKACMSSCFQAH